MPGGCLYFSHCAWTGVPRAKQCQLVFPVASIVPDMELVFSKYLLNGWVNGMNKWVNTNSVIEIKVGNICLLGKKTKAQRV